MMRIINAKIDKDVSICHPSQEISIKPVLSANHIAIVLTAVIKNIKINILINFLL